VYKSLIIQNPKAGKGGLKSLNYEIPVIITRGRHDATKITEENFNNFNLFIAAGGDGTVNEVGKALIGSEKILGIIPLGSGNGLARELHISKINFSGDLHIRRIDTMEINGIPALNVTGTGFEAEVAFDFSKRKSRGFLSYIITTLKTFFKYRPRIISLQEGDKISVHKIFSLSFANSRQFGNNAFISPLSLIDDGYFNVCIVKPFPFIYAPVFAVRLFTKSIHRSQYYQTFMARKVTVLNEDPRKWHIDGEPTNLRGPLTVQIKENSLSVVVGSI